MTTIRVQSFSISLDAYGAGPDQSREHPLGRGGEALHEWAVATRSWHGMHGLDGGVATIRQFLAEGLIDELHLAIAPALLGAGEHLLAGIDTPRLGYRCTEHVASNNATHVMLAKSR